MGDLPALVAFACPSCHKTWRQEGIMGGRDFYRVTMTNDATDCPRCGSKALLVDGGIAFGGMDVQDIIVHMSRDDREEVAKAIVEAPSSVDAVLNAVASASSPLRVVVDMIRNSQHKQAGAVLLLLLLVWGVKPIATDARDALDHKLESLVVQYFED